MIRQIRVWEFFVSIHMLLCLFKDMNPKSLEEISWLQFFEEYYILSYPMLIFFICNMIKREGTRLTFILIILGECFLIISKMTNYSISIITLLTAGIVSAQSFVYYCYPIYYFTETTGIYTVGFRTFFEISVFYPTSEKLNKDSQPLWMPKRYLNDLYKIGKNSFGNLKIPNFIPFNLFKVLLNFISIQKMNVNFNSQLHVYCQQSFPLVIFSHGLGAHSNYYSCIMREFASKGCIVLSPYHTDNNEQFKVQCYKDWVKSHEDSAKNRLKQINCIFNDIKDQKHINKIFNSNVNVNIDYNKIILIGHSFGGATQILTTIQQNYDKDLNNNNFKSNGIKVSALILLDPATEIMNQQETFSFVSNNKIDCPILIISSESFDKYMPEMNYKINLQKFLDINNENKKIFNCMLKDTGHDNFGDMAYLMPKELESKKLIGEYQKVGMNKILINKLIQFFLESFLFSENKTKDDILKQFEQMCKENMKIKSPLVVY